MGAEYLPVSESCVHCPHLDEFHSTCTHNLRQSIIRELVDSENDDCPLYPTIRADAMRELEEQGTF